MTSRPTGSTFVSGGGRSVPSYEHRAAFSNESARDTAAVPYLGSSAGWLCDQAACCRARRSHTVPGDRLLSLLRYGWGNPDWSANVSYLRALSELVLATNGHVVEAGSGVSTVLLSHLLPEDRTLISFEHTASWVPRVNRYCRRGAEPVVHTPLEEYGDFSWYKLPRAIPSPVGLIVCDGPPGSTPRWSVRRAAPPP